MHQMGWFEHPKDVAEDFLQQPKHPGAANCGIGLSSQLLCRRNFAIAA
jgi:hypothetical protein